ncbi:MAG: pirin family protein [Polyangiaceae bacterium]|jgi:redox-sensitive bicupin YhaK (pirin superfamily)
MSIQFSSILHAEGRGGGGPFSVQSIDLRRLGGRASPVVVLDDFRVSRSPFGPHPHAGVSAITYVFRDSPGGLRNRDSLGGHVVVGPGGICWLQAGRGALHEELPAETARNSMGFRCSST